MMVAVVEVLVLVQFVLFAFKKTHRQSNQMPGVRLRVRAGEGRQRRVGSVDVYNRKVLRRPQTSVQRGALCTYANRSLRPKVASQRRWS